LDARTPSPQAISAGATAKPARSRFALTPINQRRLAFGHWPALDFPVAMFQVLDDGTGDLVLFVIRQ
jgi:hypothetical protein